MSERNIICARSVHLRWNIAEDLRNYAVTLNVLKSVPGSFFMAVGWSQGYFGIQDLGGGHSGLICSVWDSATTDPDLVQQAKALSCAPGATVRRFGGEGAGLQCVAPFPIDQPIRFSVDSEVVNEEWTSFRAWIHYDGHHVKFVEYLCRMNGRRLRGFYSFIEDFRRDGDSAKQERRAIFSNPEGTIHHPTPINYARFSIAQPDFEGDNYRARVRRPRSVELSTGGRIVPNIKPGEELCLI